VSAALKRILKFYFVGAIGIVVQLLVLTGLKSGLKLHYLSATLLAVEAAVVHNFLWHERFTWAERRSRAALSRFLKFNLSNGAVSMMGNVLGMAQLAGVAKINYLLANFISIGGCSLMNFLVSHRMVFLRPADEA
jgi:dolichol-phosphate mannosyltransferase